MSASTAGMAELGILPASALSAGVAGNEALPILPSLSTVLPGGLARGITVAVTARRGGTTSIVLGLLAGAAQDRASWCAVVGMPALSLAAAAALGADLTRLVMIPDPGPDAAVVAGTLLDGFDLVALAPSGSLAAGVRTQLAARARQAKSTLVAVDAWPGANLTLGVESSRWHGRHRLRTQELTVVVSGRGSAGRPRQGTVWLPEDPAIDVRPPVETSPARLRAVS